MDQGEQQTQQNQQQQVVGVVPGSTPMTYAQSAYQSAPMVPPGNPAVGIASSTQPPGPYTQSQLSQQFHNLLQQQHQQQLQAFWARQQQDVEHTHDFKNHSLPLARIKKIMKADEDVRMISAEAPVVFARACEMFILELTLRSWMHTEENKRRTLQKSDIAAAISRTDVFDFLVDIIPKEELKEEGLGITKGTLPMLGDSLPYYYAPPQPPVGPSGMMMGKTMDQAALFAAQQPRPPMTFMPWPHSQPPPQQQSDQRQTED